MPMRLAFIFALTLLPSALFASEPILEKGTKLECLHFNDKAYGFLLERGQGDTIHASIITRSENEGEKSAFDLEIISSDDQYLLLKYFRRQDDWGTYRDFVIRKERTAELGNRMPGRFTEINVSYRIDFDLQKEIVEGGPEGFFDLACEIIPNL